MELRGSHETSGSGLGRSSEEGQQVNSVEVFWDCSFVLIRPHWILPLQSSITGEWLLWGLFYDLEKESLKKPVTHLESQNGLVGRHLKAYLVLIPCHGQVHWPGCSKPCPAWSWALSGISQTSDPCVLHGNAVSVDLWVFVNKGGPPTSHSLPQCHYSVFMRCSTPQPGPGYYFYHPPQLNNQSLLLHMSVTYCGLDFTVNSFRKVFALNWNCPKKTAEEIQWTFNIPEDNVCVLLVSLV